MTLTFIADLWSPVSEMSARRSGAGVGVLHGLLYSVGGHDGPLVRKSVECYNPDTNKWSPVADMNYCRRNAGVSLTQFSIWLILLQHLNTRSSLTTAQFT